MWPRPATTRPIFLPLGSAASLIAPSFSAGTSVSFGFRRRISTLPSITSRRARPHDAAAQRVRLSIPCRQGVGGDDPDHSGRRHHRTLGRNLPNQIAVGNKEPPCPRKPHIRSTPRSPTIITAIAA